MRCQPIIRKILLSVINCDRDFVEKGLYNSTDVDVESFHSYRHHTLPELSNENLENQCHRS